MQTEVAHKFAKAVFDRMGPEPGVALDVAFRAAEARLLGHERGFRAGAVKRDAPLDGGHGVLELLPRATFAPRRAWARARLALRRRQLAVRVARSRFPRPAPPLTYAVALPRNGERSVPEGLILEFLGTR